MRKIFHNIVFSFPLRLLMLHLKRNHFLILSWIFLISISAGVIASRYGVSLLFLDPEYLGKVNFTSFFILGAAMGCFFIVWNITSYILNAHYFSFLATLKRPFGTYCLNNSLLPILYFVIYIFEIIAFQSKEGLLSLMNVAVSLGGFISGLIIAILISMMYFFRTNKDILQIIGLIKKKNEKNGYLDPEEPTHEEVESKNKVHTEYYLNNSMRWKHTRSADHYPESVIRSLYKQHHANAFVIEIISIILILLFGLMMDNPFFRIPAASSIVLLVTILIVLIGAFYYWMRAWKLFFFFVIIAVVNAFMHSNLLTYKNKAYGIHYQTTVDYNTKQLKVLSDSAHTAPDIKNTLQMLDNWKSKFPANSPKPKLIFINCSGGGLRAMSFTMQVFQHLDSITQHKLMNQTGMITGASGGMVAAAYYRSLYLENMRNPINLTDSIYTNKISSDLLNALSYTIVVNDLFFPWQKYEYEGQTYRKDRGYMFEKILNENTDSLLFKPLSYFKEPEMQAQIPMMVFTPTIINDERKLYVASQSVSYLANPQNRGGHYAPPEIDGVDIHYLLPENNSENILFTSVLRMNCTFPYILPNVHLPTNPEIEIMDAGIRDNYGIQTTGQFISVFKDWILENTSGVIVLNIRAIEQERDVKKNISSGVMQKFMSPVDNLYTNWIEIQDYQNDQVLNYCDGLLNGKLEVITIEYQPSEKNKRASLSFHLTTGEKSDIKSAVHNVYNADAYAKLNELLK